MKLNKEKFLKTEVGAELKCCIISWDKALDSCRVNEYYTEEYKRERKVADWCQAQWEVYKMVLLQFFGIEYNFTRTDEYGRSKARRAEVKQDPQLVGWV